MNFSTPGPGKTAGDGSPLPSPLDLARARRLAIDTARIQWAGAPAHVKIMAGAYVAPLLDALHAIGRELDAKAAA